MSNSDTTADLDAGNRQPTGAKPAGNKRKLWLGLLVLSVALNIGLVGYLVGKASRPSTLPTLAPPNALIGHYLRGLPPQRREEIRPAMRAHFKQLKPSIRARRQAHGYLQQVLVAEPFDAQALQAALVQMGALDSQQQAAQAESLTRLISQLQATERKELATLLNRPLRGPRHHNRRGGRQGGFEQGAPAELDSKLPTSEPPPIP